MDKNDAARNGRYSGQAIKERQVSELIGIARGLVADNELNDAEIEFLQKWLVANDAVKADPIIGILLERIGEIYADGKVDDEERLSLTATLAQFASNEFELGELLVSTTLPITAPAPSLEFIGKKFCFTGTFLLGHRTKCEAEVTLRGAVCGSKPCQQTDYLVIGHYATSAWKNSSYGRKIEQAVELRSNGSPIAIVSESHWRSHL